MIAASVGVLLAGGVLGTLVPGAARADSAPPVVSPASPATVSADPLPTVQIDGVVWSQVVVGNTVYAAGSFTRARPAGAAAGTQETVRNNLLAYDIRTGELVTSFAPDLNAQALAVAASPDGKRVYVGGDFTVANGQPRNRVAAYDTATGALVSSWAPSVNGQVRALAATNSTVYLGGGLSAVGGVSRTRLAAVSATTGALLPWAPVPGAGPTEGNRLPFFDAAGQPISGTLDAARNRQTSNDVLAIVLTGGGSQVVVSGRFHSLNGVRATGIGALDPVTGATRPFGINGLITNHGVNSAVWSLSTDGTTVYGTGYDYYGPGNLEGSFAADANGGKARWIADCRGDTYASHPSNGALYTASHAHTCINIAGFPEQSPQVWKRATAVSLAATGTVGTATQANANFTGQPAPALLPWFPNMAQGTVTGQYQAGWSVTGNDQYVVYGGEFPTVNGVRQQGLVRYAMPGIAPNDVGPAVAAGSVSVTRVADGALRVAWPGSSDMDNGSLTYRIHRDGGTTPVAQFTRDATWWQVAPQAWIDRAVAAGVHTYRVTVSDAYGNEVVIGTASGTASGVGRQRPYSAAVHADGASNYWPLGERSGATAFDHAGTSDALYQPGTQQNWAGGLKGDTDTSVWFNGTSGYLTTQTPVRGLHTFSVEAWFETRTTAGGKIVGFGDQKSGLSNNHDRQLWLDPEGRVHFAVYTGAGRELVSPASYNNGVFHHIVGTVGPSGMALYVDGQLVASRADTSMAQEITGYWRIGADRTWSGSVYFNGRIDEVAVYPVVLTREQVGRHYSIGSTGVVPNAVPDAAFLPQTTELDLVVDAAGSGDRDGRIVSYAWTFGDGSTATGAQATHTYATTGTYPVTLTVTDDRGATATTQRQVSVLAPPPNQLPTAVFTTAPLGLVVAVDGAGSSDPDGRIASHAWDFGDGQRGTGVTASHTYAAAGTYTVRLTVTDERGGTATTTRSVTVAAAAGVPLTAGDTFNRTVSGGWGSADVGGAWTASVGAPRLSVAPGTATLSLPSAGNNTGAHLGGVSATDVDVRTSFTLSAVPTGGGTYVYVSGRRVSAGNEYRVLAKVAADGRVSLTLSRLAGGVEAWPGGEVVVPGLTYTPGTTLNVRVQVSGTGPTDIRATVWADGQAEPATPQLVRTDTTAALQAPGAVGLAAYRPTSATVATAVRVTAFAVRPAGTAEPTPQPEPQPQPPANAAPTAAFTATASNLAVAVDGRGSADTDGTVAAHAWDFGDGQRGT
ncbi:PKD domain-containing protein, partial [Geodermatophilus sp. SYSU D00705]